MYQNLALKEISTSTDKSLEELSTEGPVLLVFLRHFGCVFCKEALKDIAMKKSMWANKGVHVVLVHMSDDDTANKYFNNFGLYGVTHISDPDCKLYAHFGLTKGSVGQLFGLKNWIRGFEVTIADRNFPTVKQIGDGFQMPGVFMIQNGEVKESFVHKSAADRPDYDSIIDCCAAI